MVEETPERDMIDKHDAGGMIEGHEYAVLYFRPCKAPIIRVYRL